MMILAVSAMALPAVFAQAESSVFLQEEVSVGIAILLLMTYAAYIFYSHFSPRGTARRRTPSGGGTAAEPAHAKPWSLGRAFAVLAGGRRRHGRRERAARRRRRAACPTRSGSRRSSSGSS